MGISYFCCDDSFQDLLSYQPWSISYSVINYSHHGVHHLNLLPDFFLYFLTSFTHFPHPLLPPSATTHLYSATQKKETMSFTTKCVNPEGIMLSEANQTEQDRYCTVSLLCNLKMPDSEK